MSFLEELENNKKKDGQADKTPQQLWESCFKYFKYFVSILQKDNDAFAMKFNFVFLNLTTDCQVKGPYEITRTNVNNELKLEVKMLTQIDKVIKIKRKDERSAELLKTKLFKDNITSVIKNDAKNNYFIEISSNIQSTFRLILKDGQDFYIEYKNICSSTTRSIKVPTNTINEGYMDKLAKYILGQNPSLYTESISDKDISKIREKIELEKQKKAQREEEIKARIKLQEEQEAIRIANTFKEKSKRYLLSQGDKIKNKILDKVKDLKSKI